MTESDLIIQEAHYGGDQMPWAEFVIAGNTVFLSGAEGRDMSTKQEYPGGEPPESPVYEPTTAAGDLAVFQYTSGTTRALPEAVRHTHRSVVTHGFDCVA